MNETERRQQCICGLIPHCNMNQQTNNFSQREQTERLSNIRLGEHTVTHVGTRRGAKSSVRIGHTHYTWWNAFDESSEPLFGRLYCRMMVRERTLQFSFSIRIWKTWVCGAALGTYIPIRTDRKTCVHIFTEQTPTGLICECVAHIFWGLHTS